MYVDVVGGLFHAGPVDPLRTAHAYGEHLVLGVVGDDAAAA